MMDIDQVIRRWLGGEKIRGIARSTGCYSAPKAHQENLENWAKLLETLGGEVAEWFKGPVC
jgi:hypothetical protein